MNKNQDIENTYDSVVLFIDYLNMKLWLNGCKDLALNLLKQRNDKEQETTTNICKVDLTLSQEGNENEEGAFIELFTIDLTTLDITSFKFDVLLRLLDFMTGYKSIDVQCTQYIFKSSCDCLCDCENKALTITSNYIKTLSGKKTGL